MQLKVTNHSCKPEFFILYTVGNSGYYANGDPANAPDALSSLLKKINIGVGIGLAIIELLAILCLVKGRKKA